MVGRAARNIHGTSIFYTKSRITQSMQKCMDATNSRREKQLAYNREFDCAMKSTEGSSVQSIFELLKEPISEEQPLEVVGRRPVSSGKYNAAGEAELILPDITVHVPERTADMEEKRFMVNTDHVPSTPGVYCWLGDNGAILYIGKAKNLRRRVKSYLTGAKHSSRIKVMMNKARSIDFILTRSDRDALLLESNLIKHHQPPYNVLLKDDEQYPYICASIGDAFPRFYAVPRRYDDGQRSSKYRYFGPYPHLKEINTILEGIEAKYDLRAKSFIARHGSKVFSKDDYNKLFWKALEENFNSLEGHSKGTALAQMRAEFEEAGLLFASEFNRCRDVVAFAKIPDHDTSALVHVVSLRDGLVAGRFSYTCEIPSGMIDEEDFGAAIQHVLERQHYPSGEESPGGSRFSFFPNEVLVQYLPDCDGANYLKKAIRSARKKVEPNRSDKLVLRKATTKGPRMQADKRALEFALENAQYAAYEKSLQLVPGAAKTSLDGTALTELADLLGLDKMPTRIECYDISHHQGDFPVASRVVFANGRPRPSMYRKFNIRTVDGIDDYASMEETLSRRFERAWVDGEGGVVAEDDPWSLPDVVLIDGGPGQLNAAVKGMAKARVFPADIGAGQIGAVSSIAGARRSASVVVCALAKNKEELFVYGMKTPVNKSPDSPALLLLRSVRDESHRFALKAHRSKRRLRSQLDEKS
jgi:excinuclease ABC subunit C